MWRDLTTDITRWDRSELSARASLPCLLAVAIPLGIGLYTNEPRLGAVGASGAMTVGFGAFHRIGRSNVPPMLLATVGMGLSTLVGSLVSHSTPAAAIAAGAWGFGYGMLGVFGPAVSWMALQWVIFLVIVSGNPVNVHDAFVRAGLTLAGGLLQAGLVIVFGRIAHALKTKREVFLPDEDRGLATPLPPWKPTGHDFQFAWRLAITLAAATIIYRWLVPTVSSHRLALQNGYWVPMTAAIVLRGDFQQTAARGLGRLAGTLLGAGLSTLLAAELRPDPATTAALIVLFVWLCYTLLRVNYTLYAAAITSYVVFLFAMLGLPERSVVTYRLACTALGGACALCSYLHLFRRGRHEGTVPVPVDPGAT